MTQSTNIVEVLKNLTGTGFIGIDSLTIVEKLPGGQKNEYQGRVKKVTTGIQATIFENKFVNGYEQMVRRKLMAEGKNADFTVGKLQWGTKVENTPIILHNGKAYIQVIVRTKGDVEYLIDDKPVKKGKIGDDDVLTDDKGVVLTYLPRKSSREGQQGGLSEEEQVIVNTFKLESITELRAYGGKFSNLYYEEVPDEKEYEVTITYTHKAKGTSPDQVIEAAKAYFNLANDVNANVSATEVKPQ